MKLINGLKNQGFTLIELLIVVVILGVLAAVAIPQFTASTDDAKVAAIDSTLATTRTAIDMYFQDHSEYPAALETASGAGDDFTQAAFEDQLTQYTDADGDISTSKDATHIYGPYLKKKGMPKDPIVKNSATEVIPAASAGTLGLTATAGDPGGWKYDPLTGEIIMNHSSYDTR